MFDSYTVKKMLPKAVLAVIGMQLSWYIFTALIEAVNLVAYSVEGLIYAPFGGANNLQLGDILGLTQGGNGFFVGALSAATVGAGIAAVSLGGIGFLALSCVLAIFMAFILLMVRKIVIILLLIISPLALVAWILPGTEKYFKLWWESFSKLLLLYPMILGVVAAGRIFAWTAAQKTAGGGGIAAATTISDVLIIIVGCFGPFFLIPKLFTLAGSAFANITGMVNNRNKGMFDRLRNARSNKQKENLEALRTGHRFKSGNDTNALGKLNKRLQYGSHLNKAGFRPSKMRANLGTAVGASTAQEIQKNLKDNADYATWSGNDDLNKFAAASNNEAELRAALTRSGMYVGRESAMNDDIARVERVRRQMSSAAFRQMTTGQAIAGGTAYKTTGEQWAAVAAAAGNDDSALAAMVAKGRSDSMSAGRVDTGGAGFFDTFDTARKIRDEGMSAAKATEYLHGKVLASQGPGVLAHASMKKGAVEQLVPAMQEQLRDAFATGDQAVIDRQLAVVASLYDSMAASSPQNAAVLADNILRFSPESASAQQPLAPGVAGPVLPGAGPSVQDYIKSRRNVSDVFQSTRRELDQQGSLASSIGGGQVGNSGAPTSPAGGP